MIIHRPLAALATLASFAAPMEAQSQPGHVNDETLISEGMGGFPGPLQAGDAFGTSLTVVGDVNGDGIDDMIVGAPGTDIGGSSAGGLWILYMAANGTVSGSSQINNSVGSLPMILDAGDRFGSAVAAAGDLDGDGVPDVWVGASGDDEGAPFNAFNGPGALFAVRLLSSGNVKNVTKYSLSNGMPLDLEGAFGFSVAVVGDVDGDSTYEVAVGSPFDDADGSSRGAVWLLSSFVRYASDEGQLTPNVSDEAYFGISVAGLGDLDGNGTADFAVGASQESVNGMWDGSFWVYLTDSGGGLNSIQRVDANNAAFGGNGPGGLDRFGRSLAMIGDVDGDGDNDLAVGADGGGLFNEGTVWILRLGNPLGTLVEGVSQIDNSNGHLAHLLGSSDSFGAALAPLGDWDGDGNVDLAVGLTGHDSGVSNVGAIINLNLRGPTFIDLGSELWGNLQPELAATGSLIPGSTYKVLLEGGPISDVAHLVLGFSQANVPFRGGVLVPFPDFILLGLPTNGSGQIALIGPWPAGIPIGFPTNAQYWMEDAGAPVGWAASNGLALVAGG